MPPGDPCIQPNGSPFPGCNQADPSTWPGQGPGQPGGQQQPGPQQPGQPQPPQQPQAKPPGQQPPQAIGQINNAPMLPAKNSHLSQKLVLRGAFVMAVGGMLDVIWNRHFRPVSSANPGGNNNTVPIVERVRTWLRLQIEDRKTELENVLGIAAGALPALEVHVLAKHPRSGSFADFDGSDSRNNNWVEFYYEITSAEKVKFLVRHTLHRSSSHT